MSAIERIFSLGERWNDSIQLDFASLSGTFHLSPRENILTIALINTYYLYTKREYEVFNINRTISGKICTYPPRHMSPLRICISHCFLR